MQVATDRVAINHSLGPISTIVSSTNPNSTKWLHSRCQSGQSRVVLESDQLSPLAVDDHIANESLVPCRRLQIEQSYSR